MTAASDASTRPWRLLDPQPGTALEDVRLQLHHAAQLAAALGISYLPAQPDDSHTNLEWIDAVEALASKPTGSPPIRIAARPHPFAILVLDAKANALATYLLDGRTIDDAARWIRGQLAEYGLDGARYTLKRHYEIPPHAVDTGAAFRATAPELFQQLADWYADGSAALERLAAATPNASSVRCWPHHFDIATLITVSDGKTIGVGMDPGDVYWQEPYFYANAYPSASPDAPRDALAGNGVWNTRDWIGPVLPASRLAATNQDAQVDAFIQSAVSACRRLLLDREPTESR
jgi:hypothetical protein